MADSPVKFYKGSLASIQALTDRTDGQVYFANDAHEWYVQDGENLIKISDIIILPAEADRSDIIAPIPKLYLIEETGDLWYYSSAGVWILLNKKVTSPADIGAAESVHTHTPEQVITNENNRFVSDTEKEIWNAKGVTGPQGPKGDKGDKGEKGDRGSYSGVCTTSAGTATKSVSITGFTLVDGAEVVVRFTNGNSAAAPALNVTSTGAKEIWYKGQRITNLIPYYQCLNPAGIYHFRYNSTALASDGITAGIWELVGDLTPVAHPSSTSVAVEGAILYSYIGAIADNDLDNYRDAGDYDFYNVSGTPANYPDGTWTGTANSHLLEVRKIYSATRRLQRLWKYNTNELWTRYSTSATAWTAWKKISAASSDTAAALAAARTIAISGGATGTATSFNGSANVSIPVTALNASSLSDGTVPYARLPVGTAANTVAAGDHDHAGTGSASVAVGPSAIASGSNGIALGNGATASGSYTMALGYGASATGSSYGIAIGRSAKAGGYSVAIGRNADSSRTYAVSMGHNASAGNYSVAIGSATGDMAIVIGNDITLPGGSKSTNGSIDAFGISIGYNNSSTESGIVIGRDNQTNSSQSIAIGHYVSAIGGNSAVAVGAYTQTNGQGVSIGVSASTTSNGVAAGASSSAYSESVAIGAAARATGNYYANSTAVGASASAGGNYSTAVGYGAAVAASESNYIRLGTSTTAALRCSKSLTLDSDERDKTDIVSLTQGLRFINSIKPIQYVTNYRSHYIDDDEFLSDEDIKNKSKYGLCEYDRKSHAKGTKKGERKRVGVVAQQVQNVLMELYGTDNYADIVNDNLYDTIMEGETIPDGVENQLAVSYTAFVPFLISAIQELTNEFEQLKQKLRNNGY